MRGRCAHAVRRDAAVVATGVVLSAGPSLDVGGISIPLPYRLLYAGVPGFSSIRVPIRMLSAGAAMVTKAMRPSRA